MLKQLKDKKAKLQINAHTGPVVLYDDGDGIKHSSQINYLLQISLKKQEILKMHQLLFMNFQWKILHMDYIQQEVDPYRQGKSAYSSSLGAVYIYKRMHSITGEVYQDMFVASYVARPDKKETWKSKLGYY
jgi:hypothetical protein